MGEITYRDFLNTFRSLEIDPDSPVIAHASLRAFGRVHGGPGAVVGALLESFSAVIMPSFTYKTMVTPEDGPLQNGLRYGNHSDLNRMAEIYKPDMPADSLMGAVPETLRKHPMGRRSHHPILSFTGVNSKQALDAQTLLEPLAPIRMLYKQNGWVLLIGVDQRTNTSIHLGERLAGRKQFVRWAITPDGVAECRGFPGCSEGFLTIEQDLQQTGATRTASLGPGEVQAIPLHVLIPTVQKRIWADPLALLCEYSDCMRCQATRDDPRSPASTEIIGAISRSENK